MSLLIFTAGVILGIVLSLTLFVYEAQSRPQIFKHVEEIIQSRERGAVFLDPTDEEMAKEELKEQNAARGEGTNITDLI